MWILKMVLPKRLATILILQILLSIICLRVALFNRKHPTFYRYFLCVKCVEHNKETIVLWDKPKGALTGSVGYVTEETYWEYPCDLWIAIKNIMGMDFGSPF